MSLKAGEAREAGEAGEAGEALGSASLNSILTDY